MTETEPYEPVEGEIVPYEQQSSVTLFGSDDPVVVIAKASQIATALADIIEQRKLYTVIQGRKHVNVEGWTLLGTLLGVFPVMESCEPIEIDGAKGYVATVSAQTLNGNAVGKATALCMRSENTWSKRDDYALASMAQTRATSKCLRIPLGFIMTLAGYDATPAEERVSTAPVAGAVRSGSKMKPEKLAELIDALRVNDDAPDLWGTNVVLENARRRFGRSLGKMSDMTAEEADVIIEGAKTWRAANPIAEDVVDEIPGIKLTDLPDIEFASDIDKDNQ